MTFRSMLRSMIGVSFGAAVLLAINPAGAASLPEPTEKPILTVTGKITVTNKEGAAQFDRAMLEALGAASFSTSTPWYKEAETASSRSRLMTIVPKCRWKTRANSA
jgi:hypothetical protein